jgi:quinol-cytochrome oxidoreductase complex cytochrome b subunit
MNKVRASRLLITALGALFVLGVLLFIFAGRLFPKPSLDTAPLPSPTARGPAARGILDRPVVSNPPSQVEEGHLVFWGVCMACHGNQGQGLIDEWRELAYGEDKDCWTSKCHASSHPPGSFEFPRSVPALVGGGRLGRFTSAQQLYDFIVAMMPWWNPGSLTSEKAWQVTAYLLKLNGTFPDGITLDAKVASAVPVHRELKVPSDDPLFSVLFAGVLALILVGVLFREARQLHQVPLSTATPASTPRHRPIQRPGFILHLHPPMIPAEQASWRYTLGAGGFATFLCIVLIVTGLLEMFYYIPTPDKAAVSVETLHFFVPLGALVRNLHYWSAQLLVIVAAMHLLRVSFTGAYAAPRRFNFLLGLSLFVLVLLLDFTGYVLRWDEGIRWALTAGTNLLSSIPGLGTALYKFVVGGAQTGPGTLVRFYAWHIWALSAGGGFVLIWHLFRVRRDGGIAAPVIPPAHQSAGSPARISRSRLLRRETLAILMGAIVLVLLSTFAPAPLASPLQGNPTLTTDTRAPWFFLWVQQLLKLGDPFLLGVLLPVTLLLVVGALPYILPGPPREEWGRWFPRGGRPVQVIIAGLALLILALTLLGLLPASNV